MVKKLGKILKKLFGYFLLDRNEKTFVDFAENKWGGGRNADFESDGELLIDVLGFNPYIFHSAYFSNFFSSKYNYEIKTVVPAYDFNRRIIKKYLFRFSKLRRLYRSFGCRDGFNFNDLDSSEIRRCEEEAALIFGRVVTKDDLVEVEVNGIKIGDLIYDSYLRKYACATVDVSDKRLRDLIKFALVAFSSCDQYLNSHDVKKIVVSHAVYIEYGILARLAVNKGIDVYLFSKWNTQVVHKLTRSHWLPTGNHLLYKKKFYFLANKEARLNQARDLLARRLSGGIDAGTSYMKTSAYSSSVDLSNRIFKLTGRPRLIVMLHCFYDSPHIYRDMLFADFYEWLDFTLKTAERTEFDVYVKPHPNGLPGNEAIVSFFKSKYPKVHFIDKTVPNNQLIAEGIDAAITGYGTLGHEFPYQGVPVITAGDNPHSAYDFCNHARTKEEYEFLIKNADKLSKNISKSEIEEFYYMHYLCPIDGRLEGDNDIFQMARTATNKDPLDSSLLFDLVKEAKEGRFDNVYGLFEIALRHVD